MDRLEKPKWTRVNGFQKPYADEQVATWYLFPMVIIHFVLYVMPLLWDDLAAQIVVPAVFFLAAITSGIGVYLTCHIDPCDVNLLSQEKRALAPYKEAVENAVTTGRIYCHTCKVDVQNGSKHCKFCNKCVGKFDHHCKWLNTCVGERNYRYFLLSVFGILTLTMTSFILSVIYLSESFSDEEGMTSRGEEAWIPYSLGAVQGVSILSTIVMFPLVAMVIQLALFHIMLLYKGLTTYDYIVGESKRAKSKRDEKQASHKALKQQQAKAKAQAERMRNSALTEKADIEAAANMSGKGNGPTIGVNSGKEGKEGAYAAASSIDGDALDADWGDAIKKYQHNPKSAETGEGEGEGEEGEDGNEVDAGEVELSMV